MKEEKIGFHEALILLIFMMTGKMFLSFPRNMALLGDSAGWLIVLLAGIYSLVAYNFLQTILTKYRGKNIIEIGYALAGKYLGPLFGLALFIYFLLTCSLYIRQFAESFILAILPRTPISVITIVFLLLLIYGTMLGIETVSRIAWLFGPYLVAAFLVIIIFTIPSSRLTFLLPILGRGPVPILKYSLFHLSLFSELILLGLIAPLLRKQGELVRLGMVSLILAILMNTGITALSISVFNYASAKKMIFPVLQLTRLISFGEFIQRVEAVFVFLWFFWAGIQVGGLFYGAVTSFAQTFKIKNYRPLVFPIAILIFTVSLLPNSMTQAVELNEYTTAFNYVSLYYTSVAFGIPFLLWIISIIKAKLGGATK